VNNNKKLNRVADTLKTCGHGRNEHGQWYNIISVFKGEDDGCVYVKSHRGLLCFDLYSFDIICDGAGVTIMDAGTKEVEYRFI